MLYLNKAGEKISESLLSETIPYMDFSLLGVNNGFQIVLTET